jgi:hypothetical protein
MCAFLFLIGNFTEKPMYSCISHRKDLSLNGFRNLVKILEEQCVFSPMCSKP